MAVLEGIKSGNLAEVDGDWSALRITERPLDIDLAIAGGGSYRLTGVSGLVTGATLTAAKPIFWYLNLSTAQVAIIRYFEATLVLPTSVTTAQEIGGDLVVVRALTSTDGTGTDIGPTGDQASKRTSHGAPNADVHIAATAGLAATASAVRDQSIASFRSWEPATTAAVQHNVLRLVYDARLPGVHPIVIAPASGSVWEGLELQNAVAMTASGTQRWTVTMEWDEIAVASYVG